MLVGFPRGCSPTGAILEYAFGKMIDKVEGNRRRRKVRFAGVRALVMPVVGLPLIFALALLLPLFPPP